MFVPYFFYPLPFKERKNNKRVYTPQYILIPKGSKSPKKYQKMIKILIRKPRTSKQKDPIDTLIEYEMPVLIKPIDPKYRKKLRNYRSKLLADKKRVEFNKEFKKNPKEICPSKNDKECTRRLRRHLRARKNKSVRKISRLCHGDFGCIQTKKIALYEKHPDYQVGEKAPKFDPSLFKFMGYRKRCASWYVGIIVNRHFNNSKSWKLKDYSYDKSGKLRYCKKWVKAPIFMKRVYSHLGGDYGFRWISLNHKETNEICKHKLDVLLNHYNLQSRELRDSLEITCSINKRLITKKIHV